MIENERKKIRKMRSNKMKTGRQQVTRKKNGKEEEDEEKRRRKKRKKWRSNA